MMRDWHMIQRVSIICLLLTCFSYLYADFIEDFTDGEYLTDPAWVGDYHNFAINQYQQLQTKATEAATSYLSTQSHVNAEAEWTFFCRIATKPSAYNNMRFYLLSSEENPTLGQGWYIQVGGANRNIVLYQQTTKGNTKRIESLTRKDILNRSDSKVRVRVRLHDKKFSLESQVIGVDTDFVLEGEYEAKSIGNSAFFSIYVKNSKQTGRYYYADSIYVHGTNIVYPEIEDEDDNADTDWSTDSLIMPPPPDSTQPIYTATDYFTPNGDGIDDVCWVYYQLPQEGFTGKITILTANGLLVNSWNIDETLEQKGGIPWNGEDKNQNTVEIGVYVLVCELTHPTTGQSFRAKIPMAVIQ